MEVKKYKQVFAGLFLSFLIGFSLVNLKEQKGKLNYYFKELGVPENREELQEFPQKADGILTENLWGGHIWNEMYGAVNKILLKNEENNFKYVRDKSGFLYSGRFWNFSQVDARELALRVRRLKDVTEEKGTKVMCLMYPTKYNQQWSKGYYGIPYNDMNDFADEVLLHMRRYNVDYLDYRKIYVEEGKTMEDIFYKTDHHWINSTAFEAMGSLLEYLEEKDGVVLDPDGYYRNLANYQVEEYKEIYLGSQGRETGVLYAGLDDYTYIYPKENSEYTYTYKYRNGETGRKKGDVLNTLINQKYLQYEDVYERELNNSYLQGICLTDQITNELNSEGVKILFIRDSYSSPLAVFLAPMCSQVDLVWSIHMTSASVEKIVEEGNYDYIFVALAIDNFTEEGLPFYKENIEKQGE